MALSNQDRKKELSNQEKQECAQLKIIFDRKKKALGITQAKLAEKFNMTQPAIGHYLNGVNSLNPKIAALFAQELQVPVSDFSERLALELESLTSATFTTPKVVIPASGSVAVLENTNTTYTHKSIEMYDIKLSAGNGNVVWVHHTKEDPLVFRENWFRAKRLNPNDLRGMYVKGDSMTPVLKDRDTVLIDISDLELIDGEIYAVVYKDKFYIKQIKHFEDGIKLVSFNSDYDTMNVTNKDADRFQVLGKMVWRGG